MEQKLERQKIVEREDFTYDERKRIALKSDDHCCHCGKLSYFGFGATVDHFVPLSKGGVNRDINMVMLCETCNKYKNNKIISPEDYLPYLKKEELEKLQGYFESYIQSFEFISRNNVLSCDEYVIRVCNQINRKHIYDDDLDKYSAKHLLQKATMDDIDWLTDYITGYLKKRDGLDSPEAVRYNVEFWLKFGCIYYIKGVDGVKVVTTLTFCRNERFIFEESEDYQKTPPGVIRMLLFPKYSNDRGLTLTCGLIKQINGVIALEQDLGQVPVDIIFLDKETLAYKVFSVLDLEYKCGSAWKISHANLYFKPDYKEVSPQEDEALISFFNKTENVIDEVDDYLKKHPEISWMRDEIIHSM
ncbi:MAG: HNH endonuclease [Lachnospiraceae bacterium]|nr:HNH endonuclease [Lachnospiraceae bacterium]